MSYIDDYFSAALKSANIAGTIILENFYKTKNFEFKGKSDLVTDIDKKSEETIISIIKKSFPDHQFLAEESADSHRSALSDDPTWIIDPIDGTTNFVNQFPFVSVSIALAVEKQIILGIVYNPIMKEHFSAIKGRGSYLNGVKINVGTKENLEDALIATGFPYNRVNSIDLLLERFKRTLLNVRGIRRAGSAALDMCGVACGRLDIYFEEGINAWDIAAGKIIVEEAGGLVQDMNGNELDLFNNRILTANPILTEKFAMLIKDIV